MKYIDESRIIHLLEVPRAIEQLLPSGLGDIGAAVRVIRIEKSRSGKYAVILLELEDDGAPDFLDVYEFSAVNPDFPYGRIEYFESAYDAVSYCCDELGADRGKFIGDGMIQDEYVAQLHPDWISREMG